MSDDLTLDDFLGGRLRLWQPARGNRAGSDAVLLAAAVPARAGDRVLELGCGTGAAALSLAQRVPGVRVVGVEVEPEAARLAARNAAANALGDRFEVVETAVGEPPSGPLLLPFQHAMANPPFFESGRASRARVPQRALARMAEAGELDRWVRFAARLVEPAGSLTVIQRCERLGDLLEALAGRFGGIAIFPLWPGDGRPAKRLIVQARKGSRAALRLLPGLVLHEPTTSGGGRAYSAAAEAVLRQGGALTL